MAPRWLGKFQGFIAVTCDVTIQSSKHDIAKVAMGTLTAGHYAQSSAKEQNNPISLAPAGCSLQAGCPSLVRQGTAGQDIEIQGLRFVPTKRACCWASMLDSMTRECVVLVVQRLELDLSLICHWRAYRNSNHWVSTFQSHARRAATKAADGADLIGDKGRGGRSWGEEGLWLVNWGVETGKVQKLEEGQK
jgi:hypothetical protein